MSENARPLVMSVASFIGLQSIDGGDTLALRFMKPGDQELVVLVPRQVALVLRPHVAEVLAQPHAPARFER